MIPPFINEFATLIKLTTLGSVLAVNELLHEAENLINNTYRPLEIYTAVAVAFAINMECGPPSRLSRKDLSGLPIPAEFKDLFWDWAAGRVDFVEIIDE